MKALYIYLANWLCLSNIIIAPRHPHNIPLPEVSGSSSSSPSPLPLPPASSNSVVHDLSFEQKLLHYRFRSLEDARRVDIAKRILLNKKK